MKKYPDFLTVQSGRVVGFANNIPEHLSIPESITGIAELAFSGCAVLKSVVIPSGIWIGDGAFKDCTSLESVMIGANVAEIGVKAFADCTALEDVTIRAGTTKVHWLAFDGCKNLKEIRFGGTKVDAPLALSSSRVEADIICSDGRITARSTDGLYIIGTTVCHLDRVKFTKEGREMVTLVRLRIPEGITNIAERAFSGCAVLKSVVIPGSVKFIGQDAFTGCRRLRAISFGGTRAQWKALCVQNPELLYKKTRCADGVFREPDAGVKISGTVAVGHTRRLADSVTIPDGVSEIYEYAFRDCPSLERVIIPATVTKISWYAFAGCTGLKEIRFGGTMGQWAEIPGIWCDELLSASIICADGELRTQERNGLRIFAGVVYECADNSAASIDVPDGVTEIRAYALNSSEAEHIVIPASVRKIGEFSASERLKSVAFGGTLGQWRAIQGLSENPALLAASVTCSDGVQEEETRDGLRISDGIFFDVVDSIVIPDGVTEIATGAFKSCGPLRSITIPSSVTRIGKYALANVNCPIRYLGTKAQWVAVEKTEGDFSYPVEIHCTDGIVQ